MNWFGNQPGDGIEMNLLIFGMSLALLVVGSGRYSVDWLLIRSAHPPVKIPTRVMG
ncbi:DoxX family protein [Spirosoma arcticum]